jgi:hypothetical protein
MEEWRVPMADCPLVPAWGSPRGKATEEISGNVSSLGPWVLARVTPMPRLEVSSVQERDVADIRKGENAGGQCRGRPELHPFLGPSDTRGETAPRVATKSPIDAHATIIGGRPFQAQLFFRPHSLADSSAPRIRKFTSPDKICAALNLHPSARTSAPQILVIRRFIYRPIVRGRNNQPYE